MKFLIFLVSLLYKKVITVSEATNDQNVILRSSGKRIYNGLKFTNSIAPRVSNDFMIVGQLDYWKGQLNLFHRIPNGWDGLIHIIGDGKNERYNNALAQFKDDFRYKFHGYQNNPWNVADGRFLIHCSIKPDPLPTVVLEAVSNGVIPFVSRYGGGREMICPEFHDILVIDFLSDRSVRRMLTLSREMSDEYYNYILKKLREYHFIHFNIDQKVEEYAKFFIACQN